VRRKPRVRLTAQMHGGGHERGFRSGTLPTHQIVGMGEAFRLGTPGDGRRERAHPHAARSPAQRAVGHRAGLCQWRHGTAGAAQPEYQLRLRRRRIVADGDQGSRGIVGSACTSASLEPSYVLRALGREDELAHSSIRFTLGRFTTEEDIDYAIKLLHDKIGRLRELSPLWEMVQEGVDLSTVQWAAH
jgi:cysteine desulfurase